MKLIIAVFITMLTSTLYAKPFYGIGVGRYNGTDELTSSFIGSAEAGIEHKGTILSLQGSHIQQQMRNGLQPSGSVTLIPITLNLGGIVAKKSFSVRLTGGVGVCFTDFEISKEIEYRNKWSNERIVIDLDNDICFQIQGGVEKKLNERWSVGAEIVYLIYETLIRETRYIKYPQYLDGATRYDSTAPIKFNSVIGRIVIRFR